MAEGKPIKVSPEDQKSRRSNLAHLAAEFGTIDKLPDELVFQRGDGVIVLRDGTRVTNDDLKAAYTEALKDPDLKDELAAIHNAKKPGKDDKK